MWCVRLIDGDEDQPVMGLVLEEVLAGAEKLQGSLTPLLCWWVDGGKRMGAGQHRPTLAPQHLSGEQSQAHPSCHLEPLPQYLSTCPVLEPAGLKTTSAPAAMPHMCAPAPSLARCQAHPSGCTGSDT